MRWLLGYSANSKQEGRVFDEDIVIENLGTMYRYREGIERFFITDINNPAASAQAQSTLWLIYDEVNSDHPE